MKRQYFFATAMLVVAQAALVSGSAHAQAAGGADEAPQAGATGSTNSDGIGDIIVTAQKRAQVLNDVPMSIVATTGDDLLAKGISSVGDLQKVVPGFAAIESSFGTPIYYLRGVGFFEASIAAKPTVSIYLDEVPLSFSVATLGATLDLQRVEVLKGPQGTLFGQNATGGAINYIANKPTSTFEAGLNGEYGRFNAFSMSGFASGPVTDTLGVRVALGYQGGGAWQKSYTRPDELGDKRFANGRVILEWKPSTDFRAMLTVHGFVNKSDTQAAQYRERTIRDTAYQSPQFVPNYATGPTTASPTLVDVNAVPAPNNDRAADWGYSFPLKHDDRMIQGNLRLEYDLSDRLTLTSLSSAMHYKQNQGIDSDGTTLVISDFRQLGKITAYSQELRASYDMDGRGVVLVGANYSHENTYEESRNKPTDATAANSFAVLGLPAADLYGASAKINYRSKAVFGNVDYNLTDFLIAHAGVRYTDNDTYLVAGCSRDYGNLTLGKGIAVFSGLPAASFSQPGCTTVLQATATLPKRQGPVSGKLREDNVSWRVGLDLKPSDDLLFYGNVSRGYKGGGFGNLAATEESQHRPFFQEKLTAYEIGAKATLFDRHLQLNGAFFYYDYANKQIKGRVIVPIFGPNERIINIPKSRVKGFELSATWRPLPGLTINGGGTFLSSKITGSFVNYTQFGELLEFEGSKFPYTPETQINGSIDYTTNVSPTLKAYVSGDLSYRSSTNGDFIPDSRLRIDAYTLLGMRAGLRAQDDRWSVGFYVRNLTNTYYWTTAIRRLDTILRYTGMPRTFGVDFSTRF